MPPLLVVLPPGDIGGGAMAWSDGGLAGRPLASTVLAALAVVMAGLRSEGLVMPEL